MVWDGEDFFDAIFLHHSKSIGTAWARTDGRIHWCYALGVERSQHTQMFVGTVPFVVPRE
jgi:hypothetical protein